MAGFLACHMGLSEEHARVAGRTSGRGCDVQLRCITHSATFSEMHDLLEVLLRGITRRGEDHPATGFPWTGQPTQPIVSCRKLLHCCSRYISFLCPTLLIMAASMKSVGASMGRSRASSSTSRPAMRVQACSTKRNTGMGCHLAAGIAAISLVLSPAVFPAEAGADGKCEVVLL